MPHIAKPHVARAAKAASWIAILASTTLGIDGRSVRTRVRASGSAEVDDASTYRLVVQTYDGSMRDGARPVGSLQRFVLGAELRRGVDVTVVELRGESTPPPGESRVVAWVEPGREDLELDGRAARPAPGQVYGSARRTPGVTRVRIALGRKLGVAA